MTGLQWMAAIGLRAMPHFTTLHKAAGRLLRLREPVAAIRAVYAGAVRRHRIGGGIRPRPWADAVLNHDGQATSTGASPHTG